MRLLLPVFRQRRFPESRGDGEKRIDVGELVLVVRAREYLDETGALQRPQRLFVGHRGSAVSRPDRRRVRVRHGNEPRCNGAD